MRISTVPRVVSVFVASLVVVLAGALLVACSDDGPKVTIPIQAKDITFSQTTLNVKADEKTQIVLTNSDTVEHNLTVPELGIDKDAEGG